MNLSSIKVRSLGLCSGGLDSILSALILQKQGIEVEWITFETPFFSSENARKAADTTGIPITVKDITPVYLEMLKDPPCGYGKGMNPCMDCHALMFKEAGALMAKKGFDFLFSGEVLNQRPMSQTKSSLRYVEKQSGFDGYILRPLSARKLPVTLPEQEGLVDREMLLDFSGRSRKPQIKLAKAFGISDYPSPAGGCLLTDKGYSNRLRDLFDHQKDYSVRDLYLLKHGRHLRLDKITKIIVGRTKQDNDDINKYFDPALDTLIKVTNFPGPIVLVPYGTGRENVLRAAAICTGYSKAPAGTGVDVTVITPQGLEIIQAIGISPERIRDLLI
ncbi:MAG: tRNA 4-thiouridine(8) synthase ThiI [Deltaproteobacteria bacterium]|nr:tRNA 4-thiouridine(8) synthase ThiI [Deltaproteobacteria bacterium]